MATRKLLLLGTFSFTAPIMFGLLLTTALTSSSLDERSSVHQIPIVSNLFRAFQKGSQGSVQGLTTTEDARVPLLQKFYRKYNSPLLEHAEFIVQTADLYDIDYRLIPAISMQESTGCKFIPDNSFNCWGWGIYGDKITRFSSFREGIDTVSRGLKKNYYDQGLREPHAIMAKYTPPSLEKGGAWAKGVNYFFDEIEVGTYE